MNQQHDDHITHARQLLDDFLNRTGITDPAADSSRRYLWTDAFAVQGCFALAHLLQDSGYHQQALRLINRVHHVLGQHRMDDQRQGWISGLPEEEAEKHPTAAGLRIGKKLPERVAREQVNQRLDWERDGQYFHYLTRWFQALLQAFHETGEKHYAIWACELMKASSGFIRKEKGMVQMFWKMNVDLTEPLVRSMGAHDPLEGLVCVASAMEAVPQCITDLGEFEQDLKNLCRDQDWVSSDPLGIGGLFLNTARAAELVLTGKTLPPSIRPEYLFGDSIAGLTRFATQAYDSSASPANRLAFRECGLALGVRVLFELRERYQQLDIDFGALKPFVPLVGEIERFWMQPSNQKVASWTEHHDINAVTLACSLLAEQYPAAFCACSS